MADHCNIFLSSCLWGTYALPHWMHHCLFMQAYSTEVLAAVTVYTETTGRNCGHVELAQNTIVAKYDGANWTTDGHVYISGAVGWC